MRPALLLRRFAATQSRLVAHKFAQPLPRAPAAIAAESARGIGLARGAGFLEIAARAPTSVTAHPPQIAVARKSKELALDRKERRVGMAYTTPTCWGSNHRRPFHARFDIGEAKR